MHGSGVLAVWNDCAVASEETYEKWYQTEHLPERLSIPVLKMAGTIKPCAVRLSTSPGTRSTHLPC
jgi:hypothetical protein